MPYMNYVDWYRQQQQNLMNQGIYKTPGGLIGRPIYIDTPTSAERIGKEGANIGGQLVAEEIKRRAGEALAQSGAQAASQAGAQAGTQGATQAGTQAGASAGVSTAGQVASGLGAGLGAYNLSRDIVGRKGATASTISGMQLGAGIGGFFGPVGAGIGAGVGALGGAVLGSIFSPRKKNIEKERWERLKMYGFDVPKPEWVDTKDAALKAGNKNLAKDFVGYDESGKWVNNQFANTGKDEALRPQDIYEFATNHETFGEAYGNLPEQEKLRLMQIALDNKLVKEQQGTVDINWTPETLSQATDILAANEAKMPGANRKVYVSDFGASYKPTF